MCRIVVREKVGTWGFEYAHLTDAELTYLMGLLAGKPTFQFTHPAFGNSNATETCTAYRSQFGAAWKSKITDCFIRAADSSHPAGSTGGSWTHTQTVEELATHSHISRIGWENDLGVGIIATWSDNSNLAVDRGSTVGLTGNGQPMDITNKFRAAYIWKRTG